MIVSDARRLELPFAWVPHSLMEPTKSDSLRWNNEVRDAYPPRFAGPLPQQSMFVFGLPFLARSTPQKAAGPGGFRGRSRVQQFAAFY